MDHTDFVAIVMARRLAAQGKDGRKRR